ncbi:hypothetical protein H5183_12930 [Pseudoalteromonas sp. SR44-8]|uniref:hypothetical protein n=1 Tax=Pseudoalteromonas sp. SR44-8 TaxID=2760933 RepID=UPI0016019219|nr:hypothetical protein [Pseudoalteromonas sp. SR44-8]MBB1302247.1 hypothetical protein [Pseudoalteromonas sp. SR44-8]
MARLKSTWWQRYKYLLHASILILPFWFLYQSMILIFPDSWGEQTMGEFTLAPMPLNMGPPYSHHGEYVKDFMVMFNKGKIADVRQGYMNIGPTPLPLSQLSKADEGILHGTRHGQHVHAIAPKLITSKDKAWITLQTWQGELLVQSWEIPSQFIN